MRCTSLTARPMPLAMNVQAQIASFIFSIAAFTMFYPL